MAFYKDRKGYKRDNQSSDLWHRKVAYHKIYLKNRGKYPLPFERYEVHHIDGDKHNNRVENLAVLTPEEHVDTHIKMQEEKDDALRKASKDVSQDYKEGVNFFEVISIILIIVGIVILANGSIKGIIFLIIGIPILFFCYKKSRKRIRNRRKEIEENLFEKYKNHH